MGFYNGTAMELLCQQVVIDNPSLAGRITPETVVANGSAVTRNANGRNTQITFAGIPGKGFLGELTLSYDRINLVTFTGNLYFPVEISAEAKTYGDMLPDINATFGLNLQPSDLTAPNTAISGGVFFTNLILAIVAGSPLYNGSLRISWRRKPVGVYPGSGPGPKTLRIGDEQLGYFGTVAGTEMPTSQQLVTAVLDGSGITPPTIATPTSPDWMKFYYKGKILFIPKVNMAGTAWDNYYKAGSLYGDGDPNAVTNPASDKTVVEQSKVFSIALNDGQTYFHHRLPRGSDQIYQNPGSGSVTLGEDYALVSRLNNGEWGTESGVGLFGNYWMSQHAVAGTNNATMFCIFSFNGNGFAGQVSKTSTYNYVPILELVDPNNTLLPVQNLTGVLVLPVLPVTNGKVESTDSLRPVEITEYAVSLFTPPFAVSDQPDNIKPVFFTEIATQHTTPVVATSSVVAPPVKTNLATTNGDLNGF